MAEPTVFASLTEYLLRTAHRRGYDADALKARAGLTDFLFQDPEARIPFRQHAALWEALVDIDPLAPVGLAFAAHIHTSAFSVVGYAVRTAPDVATGIKTTVRYARLLNERSAATIERRPSGIALEHTPQTTSGTARHYAEWLMGVYLTQVREFTGTEWVPDEVLFAHPAPPDTTAYRAFFGCPVRFSAGRTAMLISQDKLDVPLLGRDPVLHAILKKRADALLEALPRRSDLLEEVEGIVRATIADGAPTVQHVARRLGLSSRTLQRRLSAEGVNYATLLDKFRREAALKLLDDERLAIHDVSMMLGFSEPKAFRRAFKRWTGKSPRTHRTSRRAALVQASLS